MSDETTNSPESSPPWCYPNVVSARPGDEVALHTSAGGRCELFVRRLGATNHDVLHLRDLDLENHPTPDDADTNGCGWPVGVRFEIGDWRSGYYDIELRDATGASTHHFVCVRPAAEAPRARALMVLATNTYHSYNYWGGANSYAHVEDMLAGADAAACRERAIGRLSRMRPFAQKLLVPPDGAPRLVNLAPRAVGEFAIPGELEWMIEHAPSPYDGSAGFIDKWEHRFAAWAETEGLDLDYATDHDFGDDPAVLEGYAAVFLVGHSEYWSAEQRAQLDAYVRAGGNLAIFSGNTGYWKVRWEDDGTPLIAHKWNGERDDPLWADEATRQQATHLWSHPAFGAPEAEVTGLSFIYGGYHRLAMCAARGSSAYTVYDDTHWALEHSDLFYGDTFGGDVPLLGYENDGCPIGFDERGLPVPDGGVGVPPHLQIIAIAPATLFESPRSPFPAIIPPESPEVLAEVGYGSSDDATIERLTRGHAVLATFTSGDGEVFNAGTTEWVHGLAAADPFVAQITRNVIARFTASRRPP